MHARARSHRDWREIEEDVLGLVVDRDREAIDVGANVGRYAVALSKLCRRVYAIEPDEELASFLARAAPPNLEVFQEVLSNEAGLRRLRVPLINGAPSATLATIDDGSDVAGAFEFRTVCASTLDRWAGHDVGFVKIDVEGHELQVLDGGRQLIRRQRPVVLLEANENEKPGCVAAVREFFESRDYAGFFIYAGATHPIHQFATEHHDPAELERPVERRAMRYVNNFFFVPSFSEADSLRRRIDDHLARS